MVLPRQEYWSGLPFPFLGDLPNPGIESFSPMSPALAGGFFYHCATWKALNHLYFDKINFKNSIVVVKLLSSVQLFCDPMDCNLPGSSVVEFSRQEYWSGLPFPSPGDLPDPGIKPRFPVLQADSLPFESLQFSRSVMSDSLRPHRLLTTRFFWP